MSNPKRQHAVPESVQRNFLSGGDERLWVYDRISNTYRLQRPNQIAVYSHIYTVRHPELEEHAYAIEAALGELEAKAAPIFQKLRGRQELTQQEHNTISEFVGIQTMRTPEMLEISSGLSDRAAQYMMEEMTLSLANLPPEEFAEHMRSYSEKTGANLSSLTQNEMRRVVEEKRIKAVQPQDFHLGMMIEAGSNLGAIFSRRRWVILHAGKDSGYIAADCGLVGMVDDPAKNNGSYGPGSPGVATLFPFARDSALMITSEKNAVVEHATHTRAGVKNLNRNMARHSTRIIFGHSRPLLESLVKHERLAEWRPKFVFDEAIIRAHAQETFSDHHASE